MSDSKELLDEANGKIALRADGWLSPEEVAALRSEAPERVTCKACLRVVKRDPKLVPLFAAVAR